MAGTGSWTPSKSPAPSPIWRREIVRPTVALIVRDRLLTRLATRFTRRVTVMRAGPGFGKSTLLWQAISENSLVPLGEDRFWRCTTEDTSSDGLAAALALVVGLDRPRLSPADIVRKVAAHIWARAPNEISLIIDDAHLLGPDNQAHPILSAAAHARSLRCYLATVDAFAGRAQRAEAGLANIHGSDGLGVWRGDDAELGARVLVTICLGNEPDAVHIFQDVADTRPLDSIEARQFFCRWPAISYVLLPETREWWDTRSTTLADTLGRRHQVSLAAAKALVRARAGQPLDLDADDLLLGGRTNRLIGVQLGISPRTVETHLAHVFDKLAIRTRVELAAESARTTLPPTTPARHPDMRSASAPPVIVASCIDPSILRGRTLIEDRAGPGAAAGSFC